MGKGDRKKREPLPKLVKVPRRQPNGQARKRADAPQDPRKTALSARCRMFGVEPTKYNRNALSGQHSGAQVGFVMEAILHQDEIPRLWATWQGFCSSMRTYRIRFLGMTGSAKGANIAMVREKLETDQSHSVDTRDQDQKDRDAVNAYMHWHGLLGTLSMSDRILLHDAEKERGPALWRDGKPTAIGAATVPAIQRLADAAER